ncbi:sulfotransferase domain-containing protein [Streptomyces sp. CA-250714]|uniref:sulfotransferase domain-containing protein n=1 Tax=Streptomyces sp. CA-250714 TaxID=3240060 RepID=UPI003D928E2E
MGNCGVGHCWDMEYSLPRRTYRTSVYDSTRWDRFGPRSDDIVISTPPKSGTTWVQRITGCLVFGSAALPGPLRKVSPWLEARHVDVDTVLVELEAQEHRRFLKTHLPADGLPPLPCTVSYLVVFRDLRDVALSFYHHMATTGVHGPLPEDPRVFWRAFFSGEPMGRDGGLGLERFTGHLRSWWPLRHDPGVLLLHYQNLLDDLPGEMRRVAAHLGTDIPEQLWPELVAACRFETMRAESELVSPTLGPGPQEAWFFHRGTSGQWRETVGGEDLELYDRAVAGALPSDLRHWLEHAGPLD